MTTEGLSLEEAVRAAVEQGHEELTRLDDLTGKLTEAFADGRPGTEAGPDPVNRLDGFTHWFPGSLRAHLDRERESLGAFNIVFFGRSGVGKSTLLSAFGRLDGGHVSRWAASDWTTDVNFIDWRDCRLYDVPGINGWGRTESRESLEAKARKAVAIADIVLLCFDTQNQQALEFEKIAAWIRDHGKPVVAVLNVRNDHWRHPALVPERARRNLSEQVRQHADNIRTQLAQIGLPGTPVVAIQSRRALIARAAEPFRGLSPAGFRTERERFGTDYLERWSNFGTLERLIVTAIAEGAADLRLAAVREDIRSRCRRAIGELTALAAEVEQQARACETEIESFFAVLGYPDEAERAAWLYDPVLGTELVGVSEHARGVPYTSPALGALERYARHLAASHLAKCHRQAKTSVDELINRASADRIVIDEAKFTETAYNQEEISAALGAVWADCEAFLRRQLGVEVDLAPLDGETAQQHAARIRGSEGSGVAGEVVRGTGIALGAGALAVPVAALAIFSNPIGWVVGLTAAGVGIAGQIQQHFGKRMTDKKVEEGRRAVAQAIADCHDAVDRTFTGYEDTLVRDSRTAAWMLLGSTVGDTLRAAIKLRAAHDRAERLIDSVRACAEAIDPAPAVTGVLVRAQHRIGETPTEVARVLLGEDWLSSGVEVRAAPIDPDATKMYAERAEQDRGRLARAVVAAFTTPPAAGIEAWRADLETAARSDSALFDVVRTMWRVAAQRPAFAVLGDYNSGKSSLLRRIVVDSGGPGRAVFDIRAVPATTAATRYPMGRFDLVDTPGLQSGNDAHDTAAGEAVVEAALVFVVVHINVLVGDTSLVRQLVAAKGERTVFLVNRCDELGVDPLTVPTDYVNLQDRKRAELRAAFAAGGVDVGADRVHCLSGDPFGLAGDEPEATAADFDEHRLWDGVAALTGVLADLSDEQLSAAAAAAAFDAAVTGLRRHQRELQRTRAEEVDELSRSEPVIAALQAAMKDAVVLDNSLREDARRVVNRHVVATKSAVARLDHKAGRTLTELVESWWKAPAVEADLQRFLDDAGVKLDEWRSDHVSAIGREMTAARLSVSPELATEFEGPAEAWHDGVAAGAGKVTGAAATLTKALANRDAVYTIGKFFDVKFKPWGAVNGSLKVAKAGYVLGAVGIVMDTAAMANDSRKAGEHQRRQESALRDIDEAAAGLVGQILSQGPAGHLEEWTAQLATMLDEQLDRATAAKDRIDATTVQAETVATLIAAADDLTGTQGGNE
ncbi:GTPase [Actinoplanes missouriensis]|uniref:GTPase n=1 Tax=Actinoplanes missouriensis TaxID=1866 RepID=UPI0005A072D0|nr:GTPase [Actinoplanes missouriensis]